MSLIKLGGIGAILWLLGSLVGAAAGLVVQQPDLQKLATGQGFGEGFISSMVFSLNLLAASSVLIGLGFLLVFLATLELRKRYKSTLALIAGIFGLLTALAYFGLAVVTAMTAPQLVTSLTSMFSNSASSASGEALTVLAPLFALVGVSLAAVGLSLIFTILLGVTFLTKRKEMGGSLPLVTGIFLILAIIPFVNIVSAILLLITLFTLPPGPAPSKAPKKSK